MGKIKMNQYYEIVYGVAVCIRPVNKKGGKYEGGFCIFLDNKFYTCCWTIDDGLKLAGVKIQANDEIKILQRQLEDANGGKVTKKEKVAKEEINLIPTRPQTLRGTIRKNWVPIETS